MSVSVVYVVYFINTNDKEDSKKEEGGPGRPKDWHADVWVVGGGKKYEEAEQGVPEA